MPSSWCLPLYLLVLGLQNASCAQSGHSPPCRGSPAVACTGVRLGKLRCLTVTPMVPDPFFVYFLDLFICLKGRIRGTHTHTPSSLYWLTLQMATVIRPKPGVRRFFQVFLWLTESQLLGPSSALSPGVFTDVCVRSGGPRHSLALI